MTANHGSKNFSYVDRSASLFSKEVSMVLIVLLLNKIFPIKKLCIVLKKILKSHPIKISMMR